MSSFSSALSGAGEGWLVALGGVVVLGALLRSLGHSLRSLLAQGAGLGVYVVLQAVLFVPLLVFAETRAPGVLRSAAAASAVTFAGLLTLAFGTRADFTFLGAPVRWGSSVGLIVIIAAVAFEFSLGSYFSAAMIGVACAAVLHDTSNVLHHLREDSYVAASIELFASLALMFWYVLRLLLESRA